MSGLTNALLLLVTVLLALPAAVLWLQVMAARLPRAADVRDDGPPAQRPQLAVLVPAHNEAAGIATTLASVQAQLRPGNRVLVVADNCSDDTAEVASQVGADIEQVRKGIGSDPRIGYQFLYAGAGYGGSCFPKDVKALIRTGAENDVDLLVLAAVEAANERQKTVLVDRIVERFGNDLSGRTFALWGLAFKPDTDDMREAHSRVVITLLLERGAGLRAYDPAAGSEARRVFAGVAGLEIVDDAASALRGADALLIVTEWKEFKSPDFDQIKALLGRPIVFDGRNLYDPALMQSLGIEYRGIGRAALPSP